MATRAPLSLKARAVGLLAQREHSRAELRRKLLRIERQRQQRARLTAAQAAGEGGLPAAAEDQADEQENERGRENAGEAAVDALLDALATAGYLDETRFVESRLHLRANRFGAQRIQQELAQHGLRLGAEQQAALRATEMERAREVWRKRFGDDPPREMAERARQTRFLLARGFAPEVVRRLLKA
jgi:regulatory protein